MDFGPPILFTLSEDFIGTKPKGSQSLWRARLSLLLHVNIRNDPEMYEWFYGHKWVERKRKRKGAKKLSRRELAEIANSPDRLKEWTHRKILLRGSREHGDEWRSLDVYSGDSTVDELKIGDIESWRKRIANHSPSYQEACRNAVRAFLKWAGAAPEIIKAISAGTKPRGRPPKIRTRHLDKRLNH